MSSTESPPLTYRPDIEGLRAVAVGMVVAVHAGVTSLSGGYVGVDVFFVISGFLITSLLVDEVGATGGISIPAFYARRARRILPVACFVIAVVVVAAYLQLGPLVGHTTAVDGKWAAVFAANIRFIQQGTSYFASNLPPSPLQHFWSLAVEEQFYLVWPTLMIGLAMLGRRVGSSRWVTRVGIVAIVAASLFWSVQQTTQSPTTAYFSTLTRAWELGAGALIAVFSLGVSKAPAVLRSLATWAGLALIAFAALTFTSETIFPGYAALIPVVGAGLVIAGGIGSPRGGAVALLGRAPLRWLGKLSFSIYLWHWPILVIAEERSAGPLSASARAVCVAVTLVLSIASYYAIENPLRTTSLLKPRNARTAWARSRNALTLGAVAILLAVGVSGYAANRAVVAIDGATRVEAVGQPITEGMASFNRATPSEQVAFLENRVQALVAQGLALKEIPPDLNPPLLQISKAFSHKYRRCTQQHSATTPKPCIFGDRTSKDTVVVFGDSHAMQWMPALDPYARTAGYRIVSIYKASCPVPSVQVYNASPDNRYDQCSTWRTRAFQRIRDLKPDVVLIAYSHAFTAAGDRFSVAQWRSGLATSLRELGRSGARIIELGPNTFLSEDPGLCLSRPGAKPASCTGTFFGRYIVNAERAIVTRAGAKFVDTEPWFCRGGQCPVIINHQIAYADISHVSAQYAKALEPLVAATLQTEGLR